MITHRMIEKYMFGHCFYLAAALHHHFGFPIECAIYRTNTEGIEGEEPWLCHHCWVVLPDGMRLDIRGDMSYESMARHSETNCKNADWECRIVICTLEDLEQYCCDIELSPGSDKVFDAIEDAKNTGIWRRARTAYRNRHAVTTV
jgi:hypothetical protein